MEIELYRSKILQISEEIFLIAYMRCIQVAGMGFDDDDFDKSELDERKYKLKTQIKGVENEIKSLSISQSSLLDKEQAAEYLRGVRDNFDIENKTLVKALIDAFVDNVVIGVEDIHITYKVDLNSEIKIDFEQSRDELSCDGVNDNFALGNALVSPILRTYTFSKRDVKRFKVE